MILRPDDAKSAINDNFPVFQNQAEEINNILANLSVQELCQKLKITPTLAVKAKKLIYDFPFKDNSEKAINVFSGEVFRALDYNSLPENSKEIFFRNVLIISSLYGILEPNDLIKPYRLEFKAECGPNNISLIKYWKPLVTVNIGKRLKMTKEKEILNLLPADGSSCIDWKTLKAFCKVLKPDFRVLSEGGKLKKPNTGTLKEARGKFLREVILNNLSFNNLIGLESKLFQYLPDLSKTGFPVFLFNKNK